MISRAVQLLHQPPSLRVTQLSLLHEYDPVGGPPQERYLNAVASIETQRSPDELLAVLQQIEQALGRRPSTVRWGPRPVDLDLLLYDDLVLQTQHLTIPHPRMHERRFVLEPLAQLAPDLLHPVLQHTISQLLSQLCASSDPSAR